MKNQTTTSSTSSALSFFQIQGSSSSLCFFPFPIMAHHEKYLAYSPETSGNVANSPHFSEKKFNLALGIVILAVLISTFLLVSYYTIITKYLSGWNTSRRDTASTNNTEEDDDHTQSPIHNIWYVRNVGLEESVINSITICKYKRGEGLVDGAECSVCLNGFHEDENLRILPKCSHGFHLSCIDMWLNSHVNCPLCRTNVVSTPTSSGSTDLNSVSSHSSGRSLVGNSQNQIGFEGSCSNAVIGNRSFVHPNMTELGDSFRVRLRSYSDLVDKNQSRDCVVDIMDDDIQPFQRSVSMDSSSSLLINIASANFEQIDSEGSSTATGAQWMGNGNSNWVESLDHKRLIPKHRRDRNLLKMLRNCSKGSLLQKGPVLMKRSFSSGSKTLLTRYRRTRNSLLPL